MKPALLLSTLLIAGFFTARLIGVLIDGHPEPLTVKFLVIEGTLTAANLWAYLK